MPSHELEEEAVAETVRLPRGARGVEFLKPRVRGVRSRKLSDGLCSFTFRANRRHVIIEWGSTD